MILSCLGRRPLLLPSSSTDDVGCVSVESVDPYPQRRSFYYKNPGEVVGAVMKSDGKTEGKFRRKGAWPVREGVRTFLVSLQEALISNTTVLHTPDPA